MDNAGKDEILLDIDGQMIAKKAVKSYFYQVSARKDSISRVYTKDALIDMEALQDLNNRIVEKFKNIDEAGFAINVSVKFEKRRMLTFGSWQDFEAHPWNENDAINSLTICWDFNAIFPKYKGTQPHTLVVRLANNMSPQEMLKMIVSGEVEDIQDADSNFFPIYTRVDFINQVLAEELINIVTVWVQGLDEAKDENWKFIEKIKEHKRKIGKAAEYITYYVLLISIAVCEMKFIRNLGFSTVSELTNSMVCSMFISFVTLYIAFNLDKKISHKLGERLFELLKGYGELYMFNITKGDKQFQNAMEKSNAKKKVDIVLSTIFTIIINIACGLIANSL